MKKDLFNELKYDLIDQVQFDAFDQVELDSEDKVLFSDELKRVLSEEIAKQIPAILSATQEIISKRLAEGLKEKNLEPLKEADKEIREDLRATRNELKKQIEKINEDYKNKYVDVKNSLLSHRFAFGGTPPLPSQTDNAGKFLTTDGSNASWGTVATGISIGDTVTSGTPTSVLYLDASGNLAQAGIIFDDTTYTFSIQKASGPFLGTISVIADGNTSGKLYFHGSGPSALGDAAIELNAQDSNFYGAYGGLDVVLYDTSGVEIVRPVHFGQTAAQFNVDPVSLTSKIVLGDDTTDGSWRLRVSGSNLLHERLESGVWVEKARTVP